MDVPPHYAAVVKSDDWQRTPRDDYVAVPSISGYYIPSGLKKHSAMWPRIKKMSFGLIDKAAIKYARLGKSSQRAHSRAFTKYLRIGLNDSTLPDPVY